MESAIDYQVVKAKLLVYTMTGFLTRESYNTMMLVYSCVTTHIHYILIYTQLLDESSVLQISAMWYDYDSDHILILIAHYSY